MSAEQAKSFIEKLDSDKTLLSQIAGADSDKARLELAKEAGFDFTAEELAGAISDSGGDELSDDELESVAGGVISGVFKFAKNKWKVEEGESYVDKHSPDLL